MFWKRMQSTFIHTRSLSFPPFSFCVLDTHIHTQTMLEQHEISRARWDFFVHHIHGRMLEKTFIKGFNTSRVFSWMVFFWTHTRTHTQVTSMHAYSTKANIYTFYHLITLSLHLSTPTNKVLVNNQTHPSYEWMAFLEAISNKSQCNHRNLRDASVPWDTASALQTSAGADTDAHTDWVSDTKHAKSQTRSLHFLEKTEPKDTF